MTMLNSVTPTNEVVKVSYPDCGDTKVIEVNFEELRREAIVQVDCIHPNLYAQAKDAIKGIETDKNDILSAVTQLFDIEGADLISTHLDSIYNYLAVQHETMKGAGKFTAEDFLGVINNVFCSIEAAKLLLDLYLQNEHMNERVRRLKYAQKGVLM